MLVLSSMLFFQSSRNTLDNALNTGSVKHKAYMLNVKLLLSVFNFLNRYIKISKGKVLILSKEFYWKMCFSVPIKKVGFHDNIWKLDVSKRLDKFFSF